MCAAEGSQNRVHANIRERRGEASSVPSGRPARFEARYGACGATERFVERSAGKRRLSL